MRTAVIIVIVAVVLYKLSSSRPAPAKGPAYEARTGKAHF